MSPFILFILTLFGFSGVEDSDFIDFQTSDEYETHKVEYAEVHGIVEIDDLEEY